MTRSHREWSSRVLAVATALLLWGTVPPARAADEGASWQFAPAEAPPPPAGVEPSRFPAALGNVGDIAFWSPNRGLLITAGNSFVPAGLYAYDGETWHQLSTVCGATDGRIAWAGPDEFWTISDQRAGQLAAGGADSYYLRDVSLCHFSNGQVVGSYAMPIEQPDSYQPMDAAACDGPDDCWFGGALGEAPDSGAFHLYWNGSTLSVVYSPQDHAVASMVVDGSQIYESVQLAPSDIYEADEKVSSPPLMHTLVPSDPSSVFHDVFPTEAGCTGYCPTLPNYGTDAAGRPVAPDTLAGFALSSDWNPSGLDSGTQQLWAVAGPDSTGVHSGEGVAHPIVLRRSGEAWTQIVPNLTAFETGADPIGVAADPGEEAAWITLASEDEIAHVDLLSAVGEHAWGISERDELGPEQGVGPRGTAGPIACPAAHECWLATSQGWLFHLTDGIKLSKDTDPFFDGEDGVITYRPPDDGVPEVLPDQLPGEGSQSAVTQPPQETISTTTTSSSAGTGKPKRSLVKGVHSRVLHGDVLAFTFALTGTAHVQLLASRDGHIVASTHRQTLRRGSHTLELRLNPRLWPTKLTLRATAA